MNENLGTDCKYWSQLESSGDDWSRNSGAAAKKLNKEKNNVRIYDGGQRIKAD